MTGHRRRICDTPSRIRHMYRRPNQAGANPPFVVVLCDQSNPQTAVRKPKQRSLCRLERTRATGSNAGLAGPDLMTRMGQPSVFSVTRAVWRNHSTKFELVATTTSCRPQHGTSLAGSALAPVALSCGPRDTMRKLLSINLLIACLTLTACSDHVGTIVTDTVGPEAPINDPDTGGFSPSEPVGGGTQPGTGGGTAGTGTGETGGVGEEEPTRVGGRQGGTHGGTHGRTQGGTGGGGTGEGGNPGTEPEGGGNGGQPVPEPCTLLLVGSGFAGLSASLLRRRRRRENGAQTD